MGNPPSASSPACVQHMAPFTQLATDLTNNTVSRIQLHHAELVLSDMHGAAGCPDDERDHPGRHLAEPTGPAHHGLPGLQGQRRDLHHLGRERRGRVPRGHDRPFAPRQGRRLSEHEEVLSLVNGANSTGETFGLTPFAQRRGETQADSVRILFKRERWRAAREQSGLKVGTWIPIYNEKARTYFERVDRFVRERVLPNETAYYDGLTHSADFRQWRIPPIMEELKVEAKEAGLWNLFLPDSEHGVGLDNRDYAHLARANGPELHRPRGFQLQRTGHRQRGSPRSRYGSGRTKRSGGSCHCSRGEIRSGFAMTGTRRRLERRDEHGGHLRGPRRRGRHQWTEVVDERCRRSTVQVSHFHGRDLDAAAERHNRHSMVIVPLDAPGVKIVRMVPVFGQLDEPHGHGDIVFSDVRVPKSNVIAGPGRGFEIAQGRLGPGRIHHCMRAIGAAERALERMCRRATSRVAFGKPLANLGGNRDVIANCRMAIEQARLLTLKAAWALDRHGILGAIVDVSAIKVIAPKRLADGRGRDHPDLRRRGRRGPKRSSDT